MPMPPRATATMGAVMAIAITGLLIPPPEFVLSAVRDSEVVAEAALADWDTNVGVIVVVATVMVVVPALSVGATVSVTMALLVTNEVVVEVGVAETL